MSKRTEEAKKYLDTVTAQQPGEYKSPYADSIRENQAALSGMGDFAYDYNTDAAYQQYKNRYTRGAQLANEDAASQAAARSGGYANSWAATSGQNAYESTMNGLQDAARSLYNQAYNEYASRKSDLTGKIDALQNQESLAQQEYQSRMNEWNTKMNYAQNEYNAAVAEDQQAGANFWNGLWNVIGLGLQFLPYFL
ncbi:MAG: hypothetical protein ACI3WR_04980 [Oscillospiraceae bacterium]